MSKSKWVKHTPARFARAVKSYVYSHHTCIACNVEYKDRSHVCAGEYLIATYTSKNGKWVLLQVQKQGSLESVMHAVLGKDQCECNWGDIVTNVKCDAPYINKCGSFSLQL